MAPIHPTPPASMIRLACRRLIPARGTRRLV